jgi:hypothetical protein
MQAFMARVTEFFHTVPLNSFTFDKGFSLGTTSKQSISRLEVDCRVYSDQKGCLFYGLSVAFS